MNYYIQHHGIKGQKWGVRRYQNDDGSLTEAGRKRYGTGYNGGVAGGLKEYQKTVKEFFKNRKQRKAEVKRIRQELNEKSAAEYKKATDYADKHGLDVDDYVDKDDRADYLKRAKDYGIDEKTARHVIEYSKMTDMAAAKEQAYAEEARKRVDEILGRK